MRLFKNETWLLVIRMICIWLSIKVEDAQAGETLGVLYREVLRQRGGVALAVQHVAVKLLPDNAFGIN